MVMIATYGIFRLGMGRILAVIGTLIFFPLQLVWTPYLRDYAKAPFFLFSVLLLGWMIKGPVQRGRLLALAAAAGLNLGLALGFRPDSLITIPPTLLAIAFFLPGKLRESFRLRIAALVVFLASFLLAYAPVLRIEKRAHALSHVILLGLGNRFTEALRLNGSLYEWSHVDAWPDIQIKSYSYFEERADDYIRMYSKEYSSIGMRMLFRIVRDYPADIIVRAYASVIQIVKAPVVFGILLLLVSVHSRRYALFLFLAILYFTGYPGTQFSPRHFFHLEFVPFWLTGLGVQGALSFCKKSFTIAYTSGSAALRQRFFTWGKISGRPLLLHAVAAIFMLLAPLLLSRAYQRAVVTDLLEGYEGARLEVVSTEIEERGDNLIFLKPKDFLQTLPIDSRNQINVGYLVFSLDGFCNSQERNLNLVYEPSADREFSRTVEIDGKPAKVFAPIYSRERSAFYESAFLGVEIESDMVNCLKLFRVTDLYRFPPILFLTLPDNWRQLTLYQTLAHIPGSKDLRAPFSQALFRWRKIQKRILSQLTLWPSRRPSQVSPHEWIPLFHDDFETGRLDRWRQVEGLNPQPRESPQDQREKHR